MGVYKDISGQRFGRLVAIKISGYKHYPCGTKQTLWECKCDCGNTVNVNVHALICGNTKTCGCSHIGPNSVLGRMSRTHGKSKTRLYILWKQMRKRCANPNSDVYKYYGERGVHVCKEWDADFEAFEKWAFENGYDEKADRGLFTIDRINPFGDYSPENCRWITIQEQQKNKRRDWKPIDCTV